MRNVFILGMHRSGTSAVAGALAANGFYAGERLLPADPGYNDIGFFEHEDVVAISCPKIVLAHLQLSLRRLK